MRVALLEPASINTDAVGKLERDARAAVAGFAADPGYRRAYLEMVRRLAVLERRGSPPDVVADAIAAALAARRPRARYLVGKDAPAGGAGSVARPGARRGAAADVRPAGSRHPGIGSGAEGHGGSPRPPHQ